MYSIELKNRVVSYRLNNHTIKETSDIFKIGTTTVKKWVKEFISTGTLRSNYNISNRKFKKINPDELKDYKDPFLKEIASHFSCGITAVKKALKKLKITRKKRLIYIKNVVKKNVKNL